ncbi:ABC transporter permease [Streptomyces sp. MBT33]|uniref:ABC transporter permease n=1 Tax=Streptomyces sp. MBT33 TaxID=1488363 RepID=UPI00190AE7E1|nr:ABC transporter permease [Streptomyces sp. MBT33]MBK3645516.1 ABC transporter permease [Streptomyces sp. MBT33]
MSTLTLAVRDSSTMLRRNLLHARRYPSLTLNLLLTPVMLLLLFVYVFGDAMSAGIGSGGADRSAYLAYLVPGILLMTIGSTTIGSAVSVATDMNEGIIARFRTMAIHRGSVLIGHVVGSVLQCVMSVLLVGAVGVAIGFRSTDATPLEWLAAIETLRGLLLGTPIGHNGWLAVAWCVGLAVLGHLWSRSLFDRASK